MGPLKYDYNMWLITLTMISLSGFLYKYIKQQKFWNVIEPIFLIKPLPWRQQFRKHLSLCFIIWLKNHFSYLCCVILWQKHDCLISDQHLFCNKVGKSKRFFLYFRQITVPLIKQLFETFVKNKYFSVLLMYF